jgi:hypothetical protein
VKYGDTVRVVGGFYQGQLGVVVRCKEHSDCYQLKLVDGDITDWISVFQLLPETTDKKDK